MKHVGVNVASDALMSQTLAGVNGGLVIAVADDVGLSSSQNEQDTRFWGRFAHLPILNLVILKKPMKWLFVPMNCLKSSVFQ